MCSEVPFFEFLKNRAVRIWRYYDRSRAVGVFHKVWNGRKIDFWDNRDEEEEDVDPYQFGESRPSIEDLDDGSHDE